VKAALIAVLFAHLQLGLHSTAWSADAVGPESALPPTPGIATATISAAYGKLQLLRDRASNLTEQAMDLLGIRYKRGGNTPENGLDCSGFVRYVFKDAVGADLPRTSAEISKVGEKIDQKDLQPGDLVFYNTLKRGFSHVGIYLGDNKFIHSPAAGGQVRIESMDIAYWKKRFNGARRINEDGDKPVEVAKDSGSDKK
jgi:cell wall-associated NlpC family hydrolase